MSIEGWWLQYQPADGTFCRTFPSGSSVRPHSSTAVPPGNSRHRPETQTVCLFLLCVKALDFF